MKIDILFSTEFTRFTKSFKITKFILIGNLRNYEGHFLKSFLILLQMISKHRSNFHKDCSEGILSLVLEKILKVGLMLQLSTFQLIMKPFASFFRNLKETIKCYGRVSKFVLVLFKLPFYLCFTIRIGSNHLLRNLFFTEVEIKYVENKIAKTSLSSNLMHFINLLLAALE